MAELAPTPEPERKEYDQLHLAASEQVLQAGLQVRVAGVFERLIEEKNGAISGLKIVERLTLRYAGPPEITAMLERGDSFPPMAFDVNILVTLDGVPEDGIDFRIDVRRHNRYEPESLPSMRIDGKPPINRATIRGDISLTATIEDGGLLWFDLYVNDALIANVPLLIEFDESLRALRIPNER